LRSERPTMSREATVSREKTMSREAKMSRESVVGGRSAVAGTGKARRRRRLSTASIVPLVLAVLAAGFVYEALQDRSAMTDIVVASAVVAPGAPVNAADTRLVSVHATDEALTRGLLSPSQMAQGWVAAVRVPAGEPITASEVAKPATGPPMGDMSIAVPVQQAAGGTLVPGDRVDVIAAAGQGGAFYVAQDLRVIEVAPSASASGVLGGVTTSYFIVVSVNKATALRLAAALGGQGSVAGNGFVQIVRSTGERPTADANYGGRGLAGAAVGAKPGAAVGAKP
jgi:Flp pilus assembly protein CpaB